MGPLRLSPPEKGARSPSAARSRLCTSSCCDNGGRQCKTHDSSRLCCRKATSPDRTSASRKPQATDSQRWFERPLTVSGGAELSVRTTSLEMCRCAQHAQADKRNSESVPPRSTMGANDRSLEHSLPNLVQHTAQKLRTVHTSTPSVGVSQQHDGMRNACKSCLFVHPHLLVPLLPPASAFTNPFWPPTPLKRRRGIPASGVAHRGASADRSKRRADIKKSLISDGNAGHQHCKSSIPCEREECPRRGVPATASPGGNPPPPIGRPVQCADVQCKASVAESCEHSVYPGGRTVQPERKRSNKKLGRKDSDTCWQERDSCHKAKRRCLIEAGSLFRCACCSSWLRRPAAELVKEKDARDRPQAARAWRCVPSVGCDKSILLHEASCTQSTSAPEQQTDVDSAAKELLEIMSRRTSLASSVGQTVCESAKEHKGIPLTLPPLPPAGSDGVRLSHSAGAAYVTWEKAPVLVEQSAVTETQFRRSSVTGRPASVPAEARVPFERLRPAKGNRERQDAFPVQPASHKGGPPQGKNDAPNDVALIPPTAQKICESPEICETAVFEAKHPENKTHHAQRSRVAGHGSHCLRALSQASSGSSNRHLLCAPHCARDHSQNKPSVLSSSVLLPSIGCGLSVTQSSLGRGSGLGLYALRPFSARSRISEYGGLCVDRKVAMLLRSMGTSTHVMRVGMQHQYLVGYRLPFLYGAAGAFVNDGRWYADGRRGPGVAARFQVVYDKKRARDRVYVVATRDIEAGEEIFTSYDNLYWALM